HPAPRAARSHCRALIALRDHGGSHAGPVEGRPDVGERPRAGFRVLQKICDEVPAAISQILITGRYQYPLTVGLEEPLAAATPKDIGLPPNHPTLPSLLKKAGYGTTLVGKWHLGFLPDFSPLRSGYDHFFGIFGGAADYFNHGVDRARTGSDQLY